MRLPSLKPQEPQQMIYHGKDQGELAAYLKQLIRDSAVVECWARDRTNYLASNLSHYSLVVLCAEPWTLQVLAE